MSRIKREVAAFIADHQNNHFVMTPVTMREVSLRTAQEQMLPKVEMEDIVDGVLDGCSAYPVPVRVYIPHTSRPLPVLIYYHAAALSSIPSRSMIPSAVGLPSDGPYRHLSGISPGPGKSLSCCL